MIDGTINKMRTKKTAKETEAINLTPNTGVDDQRP